jgi:molybdenum cofactor biosynthesis enzyme MoaA
MEKKSINLIIPIENNHVYTKIQRNHQLTRTVNYQCNSPSRELVVDWKGDCFLCGCEAWLPISVGKISNFSKLSDIWISTSAKELQQDVADKKYTHCAVDRCGILHNDIIRNNYLVSINVDESCNLRCPSCRRDNIMLYSGPEYDRKLNDVNHIVDLLEQFDEPTHIVMSGNGDPLASAIMRPLIHRFRPKNNQTIRLFTNGLLIKKQLPKSTIVDHITQYFISIDAGSKKVYEQVRLGGKWENLIDNLKFLKSLVSTSKAHVLLKFVLQKDNYHDMQNFAELCIELGFNGVINRLEDWGTWDIFEANDVIGNLSHPEHSEAMTNLKNVYNQYSTRIKFDSSLIDICI